MYRFIVDGLGLGRSDWLEMEIALHHVMFETGHRLSAWGHQPVQRP